MNGTMERVCKDCFGVEKSELGYNLFIVERRDQWELVTNRGFCMCRWME